MQEILDSIQKLKQPKNRPLIIAISGFGGAGKSTLAAKLKEQLGNAEVITTDDFIIGSAEHLADNTGEWSSYDYTRLRRQVLNPALQGKPIRHQVYDWPNDKLEAWRIVPKSKFLIVEGLGILHPDLLKFYGFKIWADCTLEVATRRGMQRDREWGNDHDDLWLNVWMPGGRMFFEKYRPDLAADVKINTH